MTNEKNLPYMKFYVSDWLTDAELTRCSLATRGAWMDLLSTMHKEGRSGELRGTREELARFARCSTADLTQALTELQSLRVATVTERNDIVTVINRRMKREADKRLKAAKRQRKHRGKLLGFDDTSQDCHTDGESAPPDSSVFALESSSFEFPDSLREKGFLSTWREWVEFRERKKWSTEPGCLVRQLKQLEKLGAAKATECLEYSLGNGYRGVFPERFTDGGDRRNGKHRDTSANQLDNVNWDEEPAK